MSTEHYRGYKFRYTYDNEASGKVKVYVEKGGDSQTEHMYSGDNGSPPYICFKDNSKPSSYSDAKSLAHRWADMNRR